jgi:hypothetical protein
MPPLVVLVAVSESRKRGTCVGDEYLIGPQSDSKCVHQKTSDQNAHSRTNHDIFAEPEDYDRRETGRNPANGIKYVHNLRGE